MSSVRINKTLSMSKKVQKYKETGTVTLNSSLILNFNLLVKRKNFVRGLIYDIEEQDVQDCRVNVPQFTVTNRQS